MGKIIRRGTGVIFCKILCLGGMDAGEKMKLSRCGKMIKRRVKIVIKWFKNASREIQKTKSFSPRGRGHPFLWTPSPRSLGPSGVGCGNSGPRLRLGPRLQRKILISYRGRGMIKLYNIYP